MHERCAAALASPALIAPTKLSLRGVFGQVAAGRCRRLHDLAAGADGMANRFEDGFTRCIPFWESDLGRPTLSSGTHEMGNEKPLPFRVIPRVCALLEGDTKNCPLLRTANHIILGAIFTRPDLRVDRTVAA